MSEFQQKNPFTEMTEKTFDAMMRKCFFGLPGYIVSFDDDSQLAQVAVGILPVDDSGSSISVPVISDVPVQFPGSDSHSMWFKIEPGAEGFIHFSQRCVDTWLDQGGQTQPVDLRICSRDDGFFAPGYRSATKALPNFQNNGIGIRNKSGDKFFWLKDDGSIEASSADVQWSSSGAFNIDSSSLTHNGTNIGDTHVHAQDNDSNGDSQQNTDGPQ